MYVCAENWEKTQAKANKCDTHTTASMKEKKTSFACPSLVSPSLFFLYQGLTRSLNLNFTKSESNTMYVLVYALPTFSQQLLMSPVEVKTNFIGCSKFVILTIYIQLT